MRLALFRDLTVLGESLNKIARERGHPDCMSIARCIEPCDYCKEYPKKRALMAEDKLLAEAQSYLIERGWILLPPPNSGLDIKKK